MLFTGWKVRAEKIFAQKIFSFKKPIHLPKIKRELGKRTFRFNIGPLQYNKLLVKEKRHHDFYVL